MRISDWSSDVCSSDLGAVSFRSVPSFAFAREIMIDSREWGPLQLDIAYGGAFYAILPADSIGLDLRDTPARHFAEAGAAISEPTRPQAAPPHPHHAHLPFLSAPISPHAGHPPPPAP